MRLGISRRKYSRTITFIFRVVEGVPVEKWGIRGLQLEITVGPASGAAFFGVFDWGT